MSLALLLTIKTVVLGWNNWKADKTIQTTYSVYISYKAIHACWQKSAKYCALNPFDIDAIILAHSRYLNPWKCLHCTKFYSFENVLHKRCQSLSTYKHCQVEKWQYFLGGIARLSTWLMPWVHCTIAGWWDTESCDGLWDKKHRPTSMARKFLRIILTLASEKSISLRFWES